MRNGKGVSFSLIMIFAFACACAGTDKEETPIGAFTPQGDVACNDDRAILDTNDSGQNVTEGLPANVVGFHGGNLILLRSADLYHGLYSRTAK